MEAVKWYEMAAKRGFESSQYNLAVCYKYGVGIEQNDVMAAKWFHCAAIQGLDDAQLESAKLHNLGVRGNPRPKCFQ